MWWFAKKSSLANYKKVKFSELLKSQVWRDKLSFLLTLAAYCITFDYEGVMMQNTSFIPIQCKVLSPDWDVSQRLSNVKKIHNIKVILLQVWCKDQIEIWGKNCNKPIVPNVPLPTWQVHYKTTMQFYVDKNSQNIKVILALSQLQVWSVRSPLYKVIKVGECVMQSSNWDNCNKSWDLRQKCSLLSLGLKSYGTNSAV